jgi:hypothetical protein
LVETNLLRPEENPARFLKVPKPKGGKKKGYSKSTLERIYARIEPDKTVDHKADPELAQLARDVFRLQVNLGMHYTEVARLAQRQGTVEEVDHPVIKASWHFPTRAVLNIEYLWILADTRLPRGCTRLRGYPPRPATGNCWGRHPSGWGSGQRSSPGV